MCAFLSMLFISSQNMPFKMIITDNNIILHLDIKFPADLKQTIYQISPILHTTEYLSAQASQAWLLLTVAFMHAQAQQEHSAIYHQRPWVRTPSVSVSVTLCHESIRETDSFPPLLCSLCTRAVTPLILLHVLFCIRHAGRRCDGYCDSRCKLTTACDNHETNHTWITPLKKRKNRCRQIHCIACTGQRLLIKSREHINVHSGDFLLLLYSERYVFDTKWRFQLG